MNQLPDLFVARRWNTLDGKTLDIAVTGSIAAVESPRFLRSLRRLGAEVVPWLSKGGKQFISETSLDWASGGKSVVQSFSGAASHIATHDALIIAPASANTLSKISLGIADSPITTLAASYLGCSKPVMVLPTMHNSLANSPIIAQNLARLRDQGVIFLAARHGEGKAKFPSPQSLADRVSYQLNRSRWGEQRPAVVLTMGSTRGYIDAIRYVSNYSSGRLGSLIAEELFRRGLDTIVIAGPCKYRPRVFSQLIGVETNEEMLAAAVAACQKPHTAGVFAAAVLDYIPQAKISGKISSKHPSLAVELKSASKIISACQPSSGIKVGFKLEVASPGQDLPASALSLAEGYCRREHLSFFVVNFWQDLSELSHKALFFAPTSSGAVEPCGFGGSKRAIATVIANHIEGTFLARSS